MYTGNLNANSYTHFDKGTWHNKSRLDENPPMGMACISNLTSSMPYNDLSVRTIRDWPSENVTFNYLKNDPLKIFHGDL